jgi:hypothetical protein
VRIIENFNNNGFAKANNQAIKRSVGKYILLLNQDTLILNNSSIRIMKEFLDNNKNAGICGCRHVSADGKEQKSYQDFPTIKKIFISCVFKPVLGSKNTKNVRSKDSLAPQEVDSVSGACFMIKKEIIDSVGLLDERYFFYYEETDWCRRIKGAGWKNYWLPHTNIVHYGRSGRKISIELDKAFMRSEYLYFRKHHGSLAVAFLAFIYYMGLFSEILKSMCAFVFRLSDQNKYRAHLEYIRHNAALISYLRGLTA